MLRRVRAAVQRLMVRREPEPRRLVEEDGVEPDVQGFIHRATDDDGNLIWPDDPDEVPLWRIEREIWAGIHGLSLPSYRTRREMEQAEMLMVMGIEPVAAFAPAKLVSLPVAEAAARFLEGLRHHADVRELSAADISNLYLEHCEAEGLEPVAVDQMKDVLKTLPGVFKQPVSSYETGKRRRTMQWVIVPAAEMAERDVDEAPFFDEPMRIAA